MKYWQRIAVGAALTAAVGGVTAVGSGANAQTSVHRAAAPASAGMVHGGESARVAANKRVVKAFIQDVLNEHHGDRAARYLTPDMEWHGGTVGNVAGRDNVAGLLSSVVNSIPDLHAAEQDIFGQGDKVVVRLVVTGTLQAPLLGIPASGQSVRWDAVDVYQLRDGKISEEWAAEDFTAILNDTGTYKAPWIQ
ncbi:ester cyclase [Streptomyces sp. GESEQ-35]|uniref:ester cyclase n=1 Tax=Streptomyces sp. GESEQ-35 TaxID=2812657 RepID=UPI001B31D517|nr:ester cyclase [Streptomyces sp. GESEQ-35]